jgi:hypothetical protein
MADKVKGWLRKRKRADGMSWLWCYQKLRASDGKMVDNSILFGLVSDIGDDASAAWMRVGLLKLVERYISNPVNGQPTFGWLTNHYINHGLPFNKRNGNRKAKGTVYCYQHALDEFILPRWQDEVAAKSPKHCCGTANLTSRLVPTSTASLRRISRRKDSTCRL